MKKLFSAYPAGPAGVALLLLRLSLTLFLATALPLKFTSDLWPAIIVDVIAVAIGLGIYARVFAILSAAAGMIFALSGTCEAPMLLISHTLDALALALIGPGVFSIDARLFGRAEINVPR